MNTLTTGITTTENKKQIMVSSEKYAENKDYQEFIDEKLINAMKSKKDFKQTLFNICKPKNLN